MNDVYVSLHDGTLQQKYAAPWPAFSCQHTTAADAVLVCCMHLWQVMSFEELVAQVLEAGGPIAHATKADAVRLHDDKVCDAYCRPLRLALNSLACLLFIHTDSSHRQRCMQDTAIGHPQQCCTVLYVFQTYQLLCCDFCSLRTLVYMPEVVQVALSQCLTCVSTWTGQHLQMSGVSRRPQHPSKP